MDYRELDSYKVKRQFLKYQISNVVISNIISPCNFQIQLEENRQHFRHLMKRLNEFYTEINSTTYNMAEKDIQVDRLCAATLGNDQTWYRCKILTFEQTLNRVKVFFIDYGDVGFVDIKNIKFLDKKFAKYPVQILNAKLFNIKMPNNDSEWNENVVNYMLMKVQDIYLTVKVMGTLKNEHGLELFSLDVLHKANRDIVNKKRTRFTLNQQLIKDGYGEFVNEKSIESFILYETLFKHHYNNMIYSSSIESDINQASSNGSSLNRSNDLYCKIPKLTEVVEFHDGKLRVFLYKIDDQTFIECDQAAAILRISGEDFLTLFESSNLSQSECFRKSDFFLYDKLDVLIDLEYARAKTFVRTPVDINDIQRDNATSDVDELKQYNDEILHEMKRNYKIYLDEFNKPKRPSPLNPLENVKFIDDYKSFLGDELYFVLEQMKVLDERIRCDDITPANKRWLELRRKTFGKKFDYLHEFRGSLLKK